MRNVPCLIAVLLLLVEAIIAGVCYSSNNTNDSYKRQFGDFGRKVGRFGSFCERCSYCSNSKHL